MDNNIQVTFWDAIEAAKKWYKISRAWWNWKEMFAYYVPAAEYPAQTWVAKEFFWENATVKYRAYLALKTAQWDVACWSPSWTDVLEEDWIILES